MNRNWKPNPIVTIAALLTLFLFCSPGASGKPPQNQLGIVVSNPRQEEGDSGSSACRFSVSIPFPAPADGLELHWETKNGSARAEDGDYESGKGTLRFKEGQRKAAVEISITGRSTGVEIKTITACTVEFFGNIN